MSSHAGNDRSRTLYAVLAVTALALAVRLVGLGARIFHWDEGRVGYWILRYHETGQYHYRPIVHGPFLFVVNNWVFSVLPPSDFSARLVVAVVGGLLPLTAWLLRDRLRDAEVVALALVFAVNPLLVYYSRFMRNDVLVGAFAFAALALFVRALDRGDALLVPAAGAALGLAFTAKENALVYLLCFLGAAALLLDHRLFRVARSERSVPRVVRSEWGPAVADRLRRWGGSPLGGVGRAVAAVAAAAVAFLVVIVFFYAPRPEFWTALGAPATLPGVAETATLGTWEKFYDLWITGSHQGHGYLPFLYDYVETLVFGAPFVLLFAVVGFVADGYDADGSRGVVAFAAYGGVVSVLGYPVATDIRAPWVAVHATVFFAVPAAVGLAAVYERVDPERLRAFVRDPLADRSMSALPTLVAALVVLSAAVGVVGANAAYMNSASDDTGQVLQWAQPSNDLKPTLELVHGVARVNDEGPDVAFVGTTAPGNADDVRFYVSDESSLRQPPPGGPSWHTRLPIPWYLERDGATVTSTPPGNVSFGPDPPPVVIAASWNRSEVSRKLPGYRAYQHDFRLWSDEIVVFVDESKLAEARRRGYV
ncbi:MAG: flippase activity-associated protein Agl23 [Haloplanus sp.]